MIVASLWNSQSLQGYGKTLLDLVAPNIDVHQIITTVLTREVFLDVQGRQSPAFCSMICVFMWVGRQHKDYKLNAVSAWVVVVSMNKHCFLIIASLLSFVNTFTFDRRTIHILKRPVHPLSTLVSLVVSSSKLYLWSEIEQFDIVLRS